MYIIPTSYYSSSMDWFCSSAKILPIQGNVGEEIYWTERKVELKLTKKKKRDSALVLSIKERRELAICVK